VLKISEGLELSAKELSAKEQQVHGIVLVPYGQAELAVREFLMPAPSQVDAAIVIHSLHLLFRGHE